MPIFRNGRCLIMYSAPWILRMAACYMVDIGQGPNQREYERNMLDGSFTCCVGSGMKITRSMVTEFTMNQWANCGEHLRAIDRQLETARAKMK